MADKIPCMRFKTMAIWILILSSHQATAFNVVDACKKLIGLSASHERHKPQKGLTPNPNPLHAKLEAEIVVSIEKHSHPWVEVELQQISAIENFRNLLTLKSQNDPSKPRLEPSAILGVGSFSVTLKCWDNDLKKWVAVKSPVHMNSMYKLSIRKEYLIAIKAQEQFGEKSPVPHSFDEVHHNRSVYHVVELIDRSTFMQDSDHNSLEHASLDVIQILDLATQINRLHLLGFLHADLKPNNIGVGQRGLVLLDLGSALAYDFKRGQLKKQPKSYSEVFSAPELESLVIEHRQKNYPITEKIDVYSFAQITKIKLEQLQAFLEKSNSPGSKDKAKKIKGFIDNKIEKALNKNPMLRPSIVELGNDFVELNQSLF